MREQYIEGKTTLKEVFAILDACEAANLKHLQRIEKLEDLCRDMWNKAHFDGRLMFADRMEELGLINTNSVHSTNELLMDEFFKDCEGKTPVEKLEALTEAFRKQVDND